MTEATTQPPVDGSAPPAGEAPGTPPTTEGEDWPKRMAGLQRAHNEETRVLREQLQALQAGATTPTTPQASQTGAGSNEEAARWKAQAEADRRALAEERQKHVVETRQTKYPHAASNLGDPGILIAMDEARLASLNELLAPPAPRPGTTVLSNGASRSTGATDKPLKDKTIEELKSDLVAQAPDWVRQIQEKQRGG